MTLASIFAAPSTSRSSMPMEEASVGTGTSALLAKPASQVRAVVNVGSASGHTAASFPSTPRPRAASSRTPRTWPGASPRRVRATASIPAAFSPSSTSASWTTPSSGGASWTSRRCAVGPRRGNCGVDLLRRRHQPLHDRPKPAHRRRRGGSRRVRVARGVGKGASGIRRGPSNAKTRLCLALNLDLSSSHLF